MLEVLPLVGGAEGDRRTVEPRAARSADAVHIRLRHLGDVEVDDVRQLLDVNAARGDIGGHQHAAAALLEGRKRGLPGPLRLVPMDRLRRKPGPRQIARDPIGPVLRAGEHQHGDELRVLQQVGEQVALVALVHKIDILADGLHRRGGRVDLHHSHIVQQPVGDLLDLRRHGGREQQRLLFLGRFVDHPAHVVDEAHVEHAVGLVEHEDLEALETHMPLPDEVVEPSRRRHEDIHPVFERFHLRGLAHAAEDDGRSQTQILPVQLKVFVILQRQLARRREHQRPDRPLALRHTAPREQLQNRHRKRGCLACPRLRAAEQIPPRKHRGNRRLLDRRRPAVAGLPQRLQNRRNNVKLFKRHTIHPNFFFRPRARLSLFSNKPSGNNRAIPTEGLHRAPHQNIPRRCPLFPDPSPQNFSTPSTVEACGYFQKNIAQKASSPFL